MAKKVTGYIKLQIPAAKATPAPPVGPALGQHGVNIVQFTKEFNARTADQAGMIIPVVITVYADRSFSFITKTPPAAVLLKKACKIESGSAKSNKIKVATISKAELQKIAAAYDDALSSGDKETIIEFDEEFHNFIVACSGNETLSELVSYVQELSLRFRYLYYNDFSLYESTAEQHNRIMEAINNGRAEEARREADAHVKALKEFVFELGKKMKAMGDTE